MNLRPVSWPKFQPLSSGVPISTNAARTFSCAKAERPSSGRAAAAPPILSTLRLVRIVIFLSCMTVLVGTRKGIGDPLCPRSAGGNEGLAETSRRAGAALAPERDQHQDDDCSEVGHGRP